MKSLFRAFEQEELRYLLIGGQAAILHGGAHFTADIDLWMAPDPANVQCLLRSLARVDAVVHKLTPPPVRTWMETGHGFHFVVPDGENGSVYLDVMGVPPRVGAFADATTRMVRFETPWGSLPVVGIQDLVELKKTNRLEDYAVITRLSAIHLQRVAYPSADLLQWACTNSFDADALVAILLRHGTTWLEKPTHVDPLMRLLSTKLDAGVPPEDLDRRELTRLIHEKLQDLIEAGRTYWKPRIEELRQLRSKGELLAQGTPVRSLL